MSAYADVYALWQACEGVGLSSADSRESIAAYLQRNPNMCFIATAEGAVVGAVLAGHDGRRGLIHHLAVHPGWRRRGIGRQLAERCLGALRKAGIQKCHLFIFYGNTAGVAFWESLGWHQRSDIGVMSVFLTPGAGAQHE
jgi:ribosomal protein S18 acetylase RimI-like enzyme